MKTRILKNDAEIANPCLKEQDLTYKCFNDNAFDKEQCKMHIDNYKTCKSFWHFVQVQRRRQGIKPHLPPVEEREQIKAEFFEKFRTTK